LVASQLRNASITLPAGTSLSLSATNGLTDCTETQFAGLLNGYPVCPDSSKVGLVKIVTPLLPQPLEGSVYLATPNINPLGALVALYVGAEDPWSGTMIKLVGLMSLDPSTGRPTLTFDDMPQLPIGEVDLRLFGGVRSLLANPPVCGPATSVGQLGPWSGGAEFVVSSSFEVNSGVNGSACASPAPFSPGLRVQPTTVPAGGSSSLVLAITRASGEQSLSRFSAQLPTGLGWMIRDVPLCGESQAAQGTCPPASRIGTASVGVGPISELASFTGGIYLTEGYGGGRYGLSIAFHAVAGPFDLGEIVVRAAISQDPSTGALTITSDPMPQLIDGVPLQTHALEMAIERSGFVLDPTLCEPRQVSVTIESTEGASARVSNPFTVEGCSPPAGTGAPGTGGQVVKPSPHTSKRGIFRIHERPAGGRLLLTFTTSVAGLVTISGRGVHEYTKKLRPGAHRVRLTLSRRGLFDVHHHRRFELKLTLRTADGLASTKKAVVRPLS
jgi:hypothetical protein